LVKNGVEKDSEGRPNKYLQNNKTQSSKNRQLTNSSSAKILYFNSNSLLGKLNIIKAQSEIYRPDSNFDDNELLGDTYTVYRNDRKQGAGGVLIAIHNSSPLKITRNINGPGESLISTILISP